MNGPPKIWQCQQAEPVVFRLNLALNPEQILDALTWMFHKSGMKTKAFLCTHTCHSLFPLRNPSRPAAAATHKRTFPSNCHLLPSSLNHIGQHQWDYKVLSESSCLKVTSDKETFYKSYVISGDEAVQELQPRGWTPQGGNAAKLQLCCIKTVKMLWWKPS